MKANVKGDQSRMSHLYEGYRDHFILVKIVTEFELQLDNLSALKANFGAKILTSKDSACHPAKKLRSSKAKHFTFTDEEIEAYMQSKGTFVDKSFQAATLCTRLQSETSSKGPFETRRCNVNRFEVDEEP